MSAYFAAAAGWLRRDVKPMLSEAGTFGVKWLQLLGLLHCVQEYGVDFSTTIGSSMVPVFNDRGDGDVLIFERLTQRLCGWTRGQVVVATSPKDPSSRICKRILFLPGDVVPLEHTPGNYVVPRGHVWLQGDNTASSHDSRHYGAVPVGLLQGKVMAKLWPPDEMGFIPLE
mmetsp:Transcript_58472/g.165148  ORF Transcript_58472/g.165148 Transcript_58472/m.165148 type:complete len:171 (-) Transcript_58472:140-652(-)